MQLKNITKFYGDKKIYDNLNLEINEGRVTAILGKSGIGKTTLLEIIAGFIKEYEGEIIMNSHNKKISYIFQNDVLLPWKTVYENIELVLKCSDKEKRIANYLKLVGLEEARDLYPENLSGGMKRRVGIARAFAYSSKYLLMDEPFQFLDIKTKSDIINDFQKIQNILGKTVIFISHDIETALKLGDYIVVIDKEIYKFKNDNNQKLREDIEKILFSK